MNVPGSALVTGAGGFLGRHLVRELLLEGWRVRGMLLVPGQSAAWEKAPAEPVVADLLAPESLAPAVTGVDTVFHCAARLPGSGTDADIWATNVTGTANLLAACRRAGVRRFVFVSSDSVYGDGGNAAGHSETAPFAPDYYGEGIYPRSKQAAEELVREEYRAGGLDVVILRPCLMYGDGASSGNTIIRHWAQRRIHLLIGGGNAKISLLHVADMARAVTLTGADPRAVGRCYNVAAAPPCTRREIIAAIGEVTSRWPGVMVPLPAKPLEWAFSAIHPLMLRMLPRQAAAFDPRRVTFISRNHVVDVSRISRELGFQAGITLKEGLKTTFHEGEHRGG